MTIALPRPASANLFIAIYEAIMRLADHAVARYSAPSCRSSAPVHAFCWLVALATTLAGDRTYLRAPKPPAAEPTPAPKRTRPARYRPYDDDARERAQIGRIRLAFATVPLGQLAERIARRLGLRPEDELWPRDLAQITQTPAEFVAEAPCEAEPKTTPQPPSTTPQPTTIKRPARPIPHGVNSS
jgi:hypothetical protein